MYVSHKQKMNKTFIGNKRPLVVLYKQYKINNESENTKGKSKTYKIRYYLKSLSYISEKG